MPHALLLESDSDGGSPLRDLVRREGFTVEAVGTPEAAREALETSPPDVAVLDLDAPGESGLELIEPLRSGLAAEVVILAGDEESVDSAIEALRAGVCDYLVKPLDTRRVVRVLAGVKRRLAMRQQIVDLRQNLRRLGRFDTMVGRSTPMQTIYDLVARVAPTHSTVLITGETGTGKELVARSIHSLSARSGRPFVPVNCGAIQAALIESELFGHEPGAFTGARAKRRGLFEQADGGTLFLDEITEMSLDLQVKLLRVLETRVVRRVGGEKPIEVDVRVLAATNRVPEEAVAEGKLREDLLYRLQVFPIQVPPLREREDDVQLLASFFLERLNESAGTTRRFDGGALEALAAHDWPGNVRELANVVERAHIVAGDTIRAGDLRLGAERPGHGPVRPGKAGVIEVEIGCTIAEAERRLVLATLEAVDGNKKDAAERLGISVKTLYNRLNTYGLGRRARRAKV